MWINLLFKFDVNWNFEILKCIFWYFVENIIFVESDWYHRNDSIHTFNITLVGLRPLYVYTYSPGINPAVQIL